jgi:L-threonylcarbamoyladenylate synthase
MSNKFSNYPAAFSFEKAVACLEAGGIVAVPTETTYGLAIDPFNSQAIEKLFRIKRREADKPLLLLVNSLAQLREIVVEIPQLFLPLIAKYWPGPLTLIFPADLRKISRIAAEDGSIAVRISPHPVVQQLIHLFGKPITGTSANLSGCDAATSGARVREIFGNEVGWILDGGVTSGGPASTIVGIRSGELAVLRQGPVFLN